LLASSTPVPLQAGDRERQMEIPFASPSIAQCMYLSAYLPICCCCILFMPRRSSSSRRAERLLLPLCCPSFHIQIQHGRKPI
jgi:hypothetical protein